MNEVFYKEDAYYLSYLETPSSLTLMLDDIIGNFSGTPERKLGSSETAICIRAPWKCLILYGDRREDMKPIQNDLEALKKYWKDNYDQRGHSSDNLD